MLTDQGILVNIYKAFNARDLDAALAVMHSEVDWPNGMEGGWVRGHEGVRDYWVRQWGLIDPHVEPVGFGTETDGTTIVDVHQVVRDLAGNILVDRMVQHVYLIQDSLIVRMDIRE